MSEEESDYYTEDSGDDFVPSPKRPRSRNAFKAMLLSDSDEDDFEPAPKKPAAKKATKTSKAVIEDDDEDDFVVTFKKNTPSSVSVSD